MSLPFSRRRLAAQEKWIFTNADVRHAEAVLAVLGIRDCFKVRVAAAAALSCSRPHLR